MGEYLWGEMLQAAPPKEILHASTTGEHLRPALRPAPTGAGAIDPGLARATISENRQNVAWEAP